MTEPSQESTPQTEPQSEPLPEPPQGPAPGSPDSADLPRLVSHDLDRVPAEFLNAATLKYVTARDGARLRTAYWAPTATAAHPTPRGTVLVLTGYSEFIEKYYEVARDLTELGFAVLCFDWRGQGLSTRAQQQRRGWVANYEAMMEDTLELTHYLQTLTAPSPLIALGHSMGGNVLIRLLQTHPNLFAVAAVTAPMLGIKAMPTWLMRSLTHAGSRVGMDERYAPGAADNDPFGPHVPLCSDFARIESWRGYLRAEPWLITHGITWRWAREAASSMHVVNLPENAAKIVTPLLVANPLADSLVDPTPTQKFCEICPAVTTLELADSEHEVLQENDELRGKFFAAFEAFVQQHS